MTAAKSSRTAVSKPVSKSKVAAKKVAKEPVTPKPRKGKRHWRMSEVLLTMRGSVGGLRYQPA